MTALATVLLVGRVGEGVSAQSRALPDATHSVLLGRDALAVTLDADPLDVARTAHQVGDARVLAVLASGTAIQKIAAIRATPFLVAPEAALAPLAAIAAGRDPDTAPEAARAVLTITRALTLEDLARREAELADLVAPRDTLRRLASDPSARGDIRRAAALATSALSAIIP